MRKSNCVFYNVEEFVNAINSNNEEIDNNLTSYTEEVLADHPYVRLSELIFMLEEFLKETNEEDERYILLAKIINRLNKTLDKHKPNSIEWIISTRRFEL